MVNVVSVHAGTRCVGQPGLASDTLRLGAAAAAAAAAAIAATCGTAITTTFFASESGPSDDQLIRLLVGRWGFNTLGRGRAEVPAEVKVTCGGWRPWSAGDGVDAA